MAKSVAARLESLEAAALRDGATILWCSWRDVENSGRRLTVKHGGQVYAQADGETVDAFKVRVSGEVAGRPPYPAFVWLDTTDEAI